MARPWRPTPLLIGSAAVHLGAAAATLAVPGLWPWTLGALAANHAVLTTTGLLPRTHWLGPNLTRLPPTAGAHAHRVALTIDDGPDPQVTPRVLEVLQQHGCAPASFSSATGPSATRRCAGPSWPRATGWKTTATATPMPSRCSRRHACAPTSHARRR